MKKLKIKQKSNRSGFTLVELVITIAIVIILSVISVPIYRNYVDKAKWAEGYALMGTIISAQKTYYSEYGNFWKQNNNVFTSYNESLGIDARGNKYFTGFRASWKNQNNFKEEFWAYVFIPEDLRDAGHKEFLELRALYNINGGLRADGQAGYIEFH